MKKKDAIIIIVGSIILIGVLVLLFKLYGSKMFSKINTETINVNLTDFTYNENEALKVYEIDDYSAFLNDYNNSNLPSIYITKFIYDGAGMYKAYDLDDFVESGNNVEVKVVETNALNINTTGDIKITGDLTGTILVNTNNLKDDVNILLNNVNIDTDSKKIPAIYVYNKDITYSEHKVTISALANTKNYIEGGKFKKVSLIPSDELSSYTNKYSGTNQSNYTSYSNYYGVYTKNEINNILFASVTADSEDLADGDPVYFYKGAGAISSDIDLYFDGSGYLEVTSKNKEGIETKGNLSFLGGKGDYVINAEDDCLNTTTASSSNSNARNTLTINVNSLSAIVSVDADEGDAIDSNGTLVIDGGKILAIAHPGSDAGIDSEKGIFINSGTVLATGDMYDQISSESAQNFMVLSFASNVQSNNLITLLDKNENLMFSYLTDRTYTNLVYSAKTLVNGTYNLYSGGTNNGEAVSGLYLNGTYTKGTSLGYSSTGNMGGMPGDDNKVNNQNMTPPSNNNGTPPEKPSGDNNMTNSTMKTSGQMQNNTNTTASNKDFTISGISNLFSGVATYSE